MKSGSLLAFIFFCIQPFAWAQETLVHIDLLDKRQKPFTNVPVELREESSADRINAITNNLGTCDFKITTGSAWKLWIDGFPYPQYFFERNDDVTSETSVTITHDTAHLNRLRRQVFLRKNIRFETIVNTGVKRRPEKGFYLSIINVKDKLQKPVAGIPISFVDVTKGKGYTSVSNLQGQALFYLPHSSNYDIDVADQWNAYTQDINNEEDITAYKTVIYDPYPMKETKKGDTITQVFSRSSDRHLSRAWFELKMTRTKGRIHKQPVYLNEIGGNIVYKALTDSAGEVVFLLPHGKKYMVHFRFQRDVDVVDLSMSRQDAFAYMQLKYDPEDKLINKNIFIPRPDQLIPIDFRSFYRPENVEINSRGWDIFSKKFEIKKKEGVSDLLVQLELRTEQFSNKKRKPLNLSFVLDASGSMAGYERIESLKEGLSRLIRLLDQNDRISLVRFSDNAQLILPSRIIGNDTAFIQKMIARLEADGSTNMLPALKISYDQILQYYNSGAINMNVILSDGYDSNPVDTLLAIQKPFREKVFCTTVGVGQDYNQGLLDKLATVSGTAYNFHAEGQSLIETMPSAVMNFLDPLDKNVVVELRYGAGWKLQGLYGVEPITESPGLVRFVIPYVYAGLQMPFLLHFTGNGDPSSVRYIIKNAEKTFPISSDKSELLSIPAQSRKMLLIAATQKQLKTMALLYEKGKKVEAASSLKRALEIIRMLDLPEGDPDVKRIVEQIKQYQDALRNVELLKRIEAEDV